MASKKSKQSRRLEREKQAKKHSGNSGSASDSAKKKSGFREWFDTIIFALVAAIIVKAFIFEAFRIPTPSMEKNLLVGDFLLVSKVHYGPRTPMSIGVPFTDIHIEKELPWFRIPGFRNVERGDPFVFNYPPEGKVIERKTHYIKRAMGLPGDVFEIKDKVIHVGGEAIPMTEGMQQEWAVEKTDAQVRLPRQKLEEYRIDSRMLQAGSADGVTVRIPNATVSEAAEIEKWSYVKEVRPYVLSASDQLRMSGIFPVGSGWGRDNYGPVTIPKAGVSVDLSDENWTMYEDLIKTYEGKNAKRLGPNKFEVDGQAVSSYTFDQDYYFAIGDNRDNSLDSRFWGFVPQDHVVGKAFMIYFSWDDLKNLPRLGRIFNLID